MMVSNLETTNRDAINAANLMTAEQLSAAMEAAARSKNADKLQCTINMFQTFVIGGTHETTGSAVGIQKSPDLQSWEHFQPRTSEQPKPRDIFGNIDFVALLQGPDETRKSQHQPIADPLDILPRASGQKQSKKKPNNSANFPSINPETSAERATFDDADALLKDLDFDALNAKARRSWCPAEHPANAEALPLRENPAQKLSDCKQVELLFGRYLNALCPTSDGEGFERSEIDLNEFLMNCDGQFKVDPVEGNFIASTCVSPRLSECLMLEAWLKKINGSGVLAKIDLDKIVRVHDGCLDLNMSEASCCE